MARRLLPAAIALGLLAPAAYTPMVFAQQADELVEEIITIGSRRPQRSASDSSVPVDVISGDEFNNMGFADLNEMLKTAVPSYNVSRNSISDAATLVRPATLRGLPPDNILVLVNGKRRHRSGVIAELAALFLPARRVLTYQQSLLLLSSKLKYCATVRLPNTAQTRSLA